MLFPQLSAQAVWQSVASRAIAVSRSRNQLHDGSSISGPLIRPVRRSWQLNYAGLTAEEADSLRQFVEESRLTADGFTFIDPWSNMLSYSEDLVSADWVKGSFCVVTVEDADDDGFAVHAVSSAAATAARVEQVVTVGGTGMFCLSCQVRSTSGADGRLVLQRDGEAFHTDFHASQEWTQVWCGGTFQEEGGTMHAAIEVDAGGSFQVKAAQLDFQVHPARYKPTYGPGGIHERARIAEGEFIQVVEAKNWIECRLHVIVD